MWKRVLISLPNGSSSVCSVSNVSSSSLHRGHHLFSKHLWVFILKFKLYWHFPTYCDFSVSVLWYCLYSALITFLSMSTVNNALVCIDKHHFHLFQHRLVLFFWALCNSCLQISENLKWMPSFCLTEQVFSLLKNRCFSTSSSWIELIEISLEISLKL